MHPFFILASQICCKPSQTQRCTKNFWLMNCLDAMTDITSNLHFSKSLNQRAPEAWSLFVYYDHRLVVLSILIQFWCDAARVPVWASSCYHHTCITRSILHMDSNTWAYQTRSAAPKENVDSSLFATPGPKGLTERSIDVVDRGNEVNVRQRG